MERLTEIHNELEVKKVELTEEEVQEKFKENQGLAYQAARRYNKFNPEVPLEDLQHSAFVGLLEAIREYDAGTGNKFSSFAVSKIKFAVLGCIRNHKGVSRTTNQQLLISRKANKYIQSELDKTGELPGDERVVEYLKSSGSRRMSLERLKTATHIGKVKIDGLSEPLTDKENFVLEDSIASKEFSPDFLATLESEQKDTLKQIMQLVEEIKNLPGHHGTKRSNKSLERSVEAFIKYYYLSSEESILRSLNPQVATTELPGGGIDAEQENFSELQNVNTAREKEKIRQKLQIVEREFSKEKTEKLFSLIKKLKQLNLLLQESLN